MQLSDLNDSERYSLVANQMAGAFHSFSAANKFHNENAPEPDYTKLSDQLRRILLLIEETES